eukprot:TRINITY_DN1545_c0_g1_i1.p1 TRINITY_DN1545_c0_g1~~TRINITY_DN1545_c0_g1_i1.p1  ORF type:complete len:221 (-),score=37.20 TRINITY_DN1545_c0_g1_i1:104-733(-)
MGQLSSKKRKRRLRRTEEQKQNHDPQTEKVSVLPPNNNTPISQPEHTFKVLLLGDPCVGKTSLIMRFTDNCFCPATASVFDIKQRTILHNRQKLTLRLIDTAGQERFKDLTSTFYDGADGIFIVFDVAKKKSFQNVENWINECSGNCSDGLPIILVGNKIDTTREVTLDEAQALAAQCNIKYIETSAKTSANVEEAFSTLAQMLVEQQQ